MLDSLFRSMQANGEDTLVNPYDPGDIQAILKGKRMFLVVKRIYDIIFSALGLLVLLPVFIIISILIKIDSPGPAIFKQTRIGKDGKEFTIYKFRKMYQSKEDSGLHLTTTSDQRITRIGAWLMKTKLDELPQAFNVLLGNMSVVGPRPESPNYVKLYTQEQRQVLSVKPGITDYASIEFFNESDLLEGVPDVEKYYVEVIMPQKIALSIKYIHDMNFAVDMKIVYRTFKGVFTSLESDDQ